jgi:hypothetical protein
MRGERHLNWLIGGVQVKQRLYRRRDFARAP